MLSKSENFPQLSVAQVPDPTLTGRDSHFGQGFFLLDHVVDSFLKGVFGDKAVHHHVAFLPDPVGAVGGLGFHRRIPPQVVMDHMARGRQIQPGSGSFQRQNEKFVGMVVLKFVDQSFPLVD